MHHNYYVYILSSTRRVLYIGVTNDLVRRIEQHRKGLVPGFTRRYNVDQLVYYEHYVDAAAAIARETVLKRWLRARKVQLIEAANPDWVDRAGEIGLADVGSMEEPA